MIYYAKSDPKITVKEHLEQVSKTAEQYGMDIGCGNSARIAGLFHDFGKYSQDFQGVLLGTKTRVDHAICGAAFLYTASNRERKNYVPIVEAIYAHHDRLKGFFEIEEALKQSIQDEKPIENDGRYAALSGRNQYETAFAAFLKDFPKPNLNTNGEAPITDNDVSHMLYTRMLYSCLVDADYSVSAAEKNPAYFNETDGEQADFTEMLQRLNEYREDIRRKSTSKVKVNAIRDEVFTKCGEAGKNSATGVFTLIAPTGARFILWTGRKTA